MATLRTIVLLLLFIGSAGMAQAQTFFLQPAKSLNSNGNWEIKLLHKPDRDIRYDYSQNLDGLNAFLKVGANPNNYNLTQASVSGVFSELNPQDMGLTPGKYYARITNSTATTTNGILIDPREDLVYSNEILLIIEAQNAPTVFAPRGEITNATPTFEWEDIPGVEAYWIIFSSTPFEIVTDENDDLSVEGANLVWQFITSDNSAIYGEINDNIQGSFEAPPLDPGTEYSYAILNLYEEDNPAFASAVFGGIIPMTYVNENAVPQTTLSSPVMDEEFFAEETITFEWTEVPEAAYYRINLLEKVTQQGVDATIPIWTTTTSNTLIDYPAIANLKSSEYFWNVVTHDDFGGGTTSGTATTPNNRFVYEISTGEVVIRARNATDNTLLQGVEIRARALSGGVTPTAPFLLQASSVSEELVTGTYEFEAEITGYETQVIVTEIEPDQTRNITFQMEPLPAFVSGTLVDENGEVVPNAEAVLIQFSTDQEFSTLTDINGEFSIYVPAGDFRFRVQKPGFATTDEQVVTLVLGQQFEFGTLAIENDIAEVSGYVLSSGGNPIQLASVRAQKGEQIINLTTNSEGFYNFTLSSGNWVLSASRNGFVAGQPQQLSLGTGDNIQNNNFTLAGGANQVTGFVREVIANPDGSTSLSAMRNVTVTATPISGSAVTAVTNINGQFTLNLGSGSFTISAGRNGYSLQSTLNVVLEFAETLSNLELIMEPNESSISGFAFLPDGTELGNVTISIPGLLSTTTTPSGAYTISTAPGDYELRASRSGYIAGAPKNISVEPGQNLDGINFTLAPNAATIRGRVSSNGLSVVNASVRATSSTGQVYTANTDNFGNYELNIVPGTFGVVAQKSGFLSSAPLSIVLSPGQQINNRNFTLVENIAPISGIVSSGATVLRNASVVVTSPDDPGFSESTLTQVSGSYGFTLPAGKSYKITASKTGYSTQILETEVLQPSQTAVTFNLNLTENPASISGAVTNQNGLGITGVTVQAVDGQGNVVSSAVSQANGLYTLGLFGGTYTIRAQRPGHLPAAFESTVSTGQNISNVNVVLAENFASVTGQITSTDGDMPLENVVINISRQGGGNNATRTSGATGNYSYARLTTGSYTITYTLDGYLTETITDYAVTDGQQIQLPLQMIPLTGEISGLVKDALGNPVANASVIATNSIGLPITTLTSGDGSFVFEEIEYDSFTIVANASGFTSSEPVTVTISPDDPSDSSSELEVVENNGVVTGQILDSVTDAGVRLVSVSVSGPNGSGNAITDNAGTYTISNLSPGVYSVEAIRDGYTTFEQASINVTPENPVQTINGVVTLNNGQINGTVTNQVGGSLGSAVNIRAVSGTLSYTTQSNNTGEFTFENVETGRTYQIETEAFGLGLVNSSIETDYPLGQASVELDDLIVTVNNSAVSGNAGIGGAELRLIDAGTNNVVNVKTSEPDGTYRFRFLPQGDYRLDITRSGYLFNPTTVDVSDLSFGETRIVNFAATANVGTITVSAINTDGEPVTGTSYSVVSSDEEIILSSNSGAQGTATFANIPAGKTYLVRATADGYAAEPDVAQVELGVGATESVQFTMLQNLSSISGTVTRTDTDVAVRDVRIRATNLETNVSREVVTLANGSYSISSIPAGNYRIIARLAGFIPDTLASVAVEFAQSVPNQNLEIIPSQLRFLRGSVVYQGVGVEGATVLIESDQNYELTTNSSGLFRVNNFPMRQTEETVAVVTMTSGQITQTQILTLSNDLIGGSFTTDDFVLPSGQISVTVTDGVNPIQGISSNLGRVGSSNTTNYTTDENGQFETPATLRAGEYRIAVSTDEYLLPNQTYRVTLDTDISLVDREIALPYTFTPPDSTLASEGTLVKVDVADGYNVDAVVGTLYFKRESQSAFQTAELLPVNGSLEGTIPAQFTLENIVTYVEINDPNRPATFVSPEYTLTPLAIDLISSISVDPVLTGTRLRANDTYRFNLTIRDGENNNMTDRFTGEEGSLVVTAADGAPFSATVSGNQVQISTNASGSANLTIRANLAPQVFVRNITVQVVNTPVASLNLNRPSQRVNNATQSSFSYVARDAEGNRILLGDKLKFSLSKEGIGSISSTGRYTPNPNVITEFKGIITDEITGLTAESDVVTMFAAIREGTDYTLTNGEDLSLFIPSEAIQGPAEVSLRISTPEKPKKYVIAEGTNLSLTASDVIYRIRFSGEALNPGASLTIPEQESLALFQGEKHVGRFDQSTLQWELFPTTRTGVGYRIENFTQLGQFTVLSENLPLGVEKLGILPNPFSPMIEPGARIGYMLTTDSPPAIVSMEIYNLRGQLVRKILTDVEQLPGRYGSSNSPLEITWDGLTEDGTMANNGRYILRMNVRDGKNEVEKLEQIILIK